MPGTLNVGGHDIITHSGDAGAGDVTVNVQDRLVLNSSGNVGVGTNSPTGGKLHIAHGNDFAIYTLGAFNFQAKFESSDSEAAIVIEDNNSTNDGNRIGVIGDNMAFTTANAERMRIDSSGNVGIGCSPDCELHVNNALGYFKANVSGSSTPARLQFGYNTDGSEIYTNNYGGNLILNADYPNNKASSYIWFHVDNTLRMSIDSSGNIGAPSGTNIYNASDQRLKQNITDLSGCLQKVLLMRGVSFNWIDEFCESEADKTLYGLIAQELQTVDSNLVDSFSDNTITAGEVTVENPLRVNEKFIIPMLVESIKEQQAIIEALTTRIEALENA